jgi:hypothetical protein
VIQIAAALGMDEYGVIGRLHKLWAWAGAQTVDGRILVTEMSRCERDKSHADVTLMSRDCPATVPLESWIDRYVGAPGFAAAMVATGWLQRNRNALVFPKFDRWNAQTAKQRLLATRRKAISRADETPKPVAKMSRSHRDQNATTEQNRTEHIEENPLTPLQGGPRPKPTRKAPARKEAPENVPVPESLGTAEFTTAWLDWLADRAKRRKPLTERAATEQLRLLEPLGPLRAVECIRLSIANGWQGLFPERFIQQRKPQQQNLDRGAQQEQRIIQQIRESMEMP